MHRLLLCIFTAKRDRSDKHPWIGSNMGCGMELSWDVLQPGSLQMSEEALQCPTGDMGAIRVLKQVTEPFRDMGHR